MGLDESALRATGMSEEPASGEGRAVAAATRVVLRPLATPLPLAFLALLLATVAYSAVQLGWVPATQGRLAGLTAVVATAPLQAVAAVLGFGARDPVAGTGCGLLSGTWAVTGISTLTSPPGATNPGLGVLLITAGVAVLVPALAGRSKLVPALVMAVAGLRFAVTGVYEASASPAWRTAAGWTGLVVGAVALYAALALELEGATRRTVLPVGRSGKARASVQGEEALDPAELVREPGVRSRL